MNEHIVFGLFALAVAVITLLQVLCGQQDALLALLRRFWGRRVGHSVYFLSHVALPLLICVLCLGWGIREYDTSLVASRGAAELSEPLRLEIKVLPMIPHQLSYPEHFALWERLLAA